MRASFRIPGAHVEKPGVVLRVSKPTQGRQSQEAPWNSLAGQASVTVVRNPVSEDQGESQEEDKATSGLYK